ncbi:MAG: type II and III secretion system family protein, partial [Alphaproteobacteria bacterium]|nr:type II and III secretion system family protein [Alphaproteobacteria bacterium]
NLIPIVEVREMDSLMRMKSGQVMVLGGLMEQVGTNTDAGVPFVSGIPWVGNAFKSVSKREQVRELFILVKATIVGSNSSVGQADKDIYNKFTGDHRPLAF